NASAKLTPPRTKMLGYEYHGMTVARISTMRHDLRLGASSIRVPAQRISTLASRSPAYGFTQTAWKIAGCDTATKPMAQMRPVLPTSRRDSGIITSADSTEATKAGARIAHSDAPNSKYSTRNDQRN